MVWRARLSGAARARGAERGSVAPQPGFVDKEELLSCGAKYLVQAQHPVREGAF